MNLTTFELKFKTVKQYGLYPEERTTGVLLIQHKNKV